MYILYIDESGNPDDPADKHFVLGGAAIFERTVHFLAAELDQVQTKHFPGVPPIEFHASHIRSGKGFWRDVDKEKRAALLEDIAKTIASQKKGVVLFSAVIEKNESVYGEDAVKYATEQMCKRFDTLLVRRFKQESEPQRGLLVFAESHYEQRARVWVKDFRRLGTQWGVLNNICDIPYFASTRETRMLQVADFVSYAVYLSYERGDNSLMGPILSHFDQDGGVFHGLVHYSKARSSCTCPACKSRRK